MTTEHRRLRVITAALLSILIAALTVTGVLAYRFKQHDAKLVACHAAADASFWEGNMLLAEIKGDADDAGYSEWRMEQALKSIGEDSTPGAMATCDDLFWGDNPTDPLPSGAI